MEKETVEFLRQALGAIDGAEKKIDGIRNATARACTKREESIATYLQHKQESIDDFEPSALSSTYHSLPDKFDNVSKPAKFDAENSYSSIFEYAPTELHSELKNYMPGMMQYWCSECDNLKHANENMKKAFCDTEKALHDTNYSLTNERRQRKQYEKWYRDSASALKDSASIRQLFNWRTKGEELSDVQQRNLKETDSAIRKWYEKPEVQNNVGAESESDDSPVDDAESMGTPQHTVEGSTGDISEQ